MKQIIIALSIFITTTSNGQSSGNINYQSQVRYPESNIEATLPDGKNILITVTGMANVKADTYVAIFSLTQSGKTTEEVNSLLDNRIQLALTEIQKKTGIETYVDMVSFVPVYEYEMDKKTFSKRTYNETPVGFELKKNIHIKFSKAGDLNEIIAVLSRSEIYDLVRVDYFSNTMEAAKKELMIKAKLIVQDKLKNYQSVIGEKLDSVQKQVADVYKVVLPVEMYKSYQAYNSSSLNIRKSGVINQADKTTTLYYQPVIDKEFDFVINPTILEPVIQVMYEIKLMVNREKAELVKKPLKHYIMITPAGEVKNLNLPGE